MVRVLALEARGRWFESNLRDHMKCTLFEYHIFECHIFEYHIFECQVPGTLWLTIVQACGRSLGLAWRTIRRNEGT